MLRRVNILFLQYVNIIAKRRRSEKHVALFYVDVLRNSKKTPIFLIVEHIGVYFFFRFVFLVETSNNIF